MPVVSTRRLAGFGDELVAGERWEELRARSGSDVAFLAREWLESWWETLGSGELLLIAALRDEEPVALAPFYAADGVVALLGGGSSDYLDFLGEIDDPEVLDSLLTSASAAVAGFRGFRFEALRDESTTVGLLHEAGTRLGLDPVEERLQPAPAMPGEALLEASRRKSLRRHERFFERTGSLEVRHLRGRELARVDLKIFFDQHVARWQSTPYPSLFGEDAHRRFYERLARTGADWLRFTSVTWDARPIAFHFGLSFGGSYLWYKPTFEIELARHSPGEVLLRHLFLAAAEEGAHTFDFGLGDEPFKYRFATSSPSVRTWFLRADSSLASAATFRQDGEAATRSRR